MPKRVLIADDNKIVRKMLKLVLAKVPDVTVCCEAEDGRSAVENALALRPDLLILDVRMPELNGIEVASIVRQNLPEAKTLLFTMYGDLVGPKLAACVGVDVVLPKVQGASALVEAINKLVQGSSIPKGETSNG
jgi:NarL family two-component system response regulator LiaR